MLHEDCEPTEDNSTTMDMEVEVEVEVQKGHKLCDYVSPLLHLRSESGWVLNQYVCLCEHEMC